MYLILGPESLCQLQQAFTQGLGNEVSALPQEMDLDILDDLLSPKGLYKGLGPVEEFREGADGVGLSPHHLHFQTLNCVS